MKRGSTQKNSKIKESIDNGEYEICRSERALDSLAEFCWIHPELTFAGALKEWSVEYLEWKNDPELYKILNGNNVKEK
jgi:hypothetical protein